MFSPTADHCGMTVCACVCVCVCVWLPVPGIFDAPTGNRGGFTHGRSHDCKVRRLSPISRQTQGQRKGGCDRLHRIHLILQRKGGGGGFKLLFRTHPQVWGMGMQGILCGSASTTPLPSVAGRWWEGGGAQCETTAWDTAPSRTLLVELHKNRPGPSHDQLSTPAQAGGDSWGDGPQGRAVYSSAVYCCDMRFCKGHVKPEHCLVFVGV